MKKGAAYGRRNALLTGVIIAISAAFLGSCANGNSSQPPKKPVAPVSVGTVAQKTVPVLLTAIGNVETVSTIQVKSQIGGILDKVHFKEGQDVAKGSLLFTIDPRQYEAQVKQAEANLAKDKAQLENAREEAQRYGELVKKGYVAREQYEQYRTNAAALEATVNADKAMAENAHLQLKYCYIYSPITGRTGNLIAAEGNLIKASADTSMVVINQIQPIYVTFSLPEQNLPEIKKYMAQGKVTVGAYLSKDDKTPEQGVLTFVDNTVDPTTGTIKLKATFQNAQKKLWPGQFVNVALTLTTQPNALLLPTSAIQTGQSGQFVFVVKKDNTVESRPIAAGRAIGDETVIEKGVTPGETVVTDGQVRLVPGAKVEIKNNAGAGLPAPAVGNNP
ncbi:MAG: efflux RND transporter periplasmic adaptor subunit [Thermodesulfovibrionales bacterium]